MMKRDVGKAVAVAVLIAAVFVGAAALWGRDLFAFFSNGDALQAWVADQGVLAPLAMVALIVAQIVVAVLPGEPVELGAGYAFGFWEGTALCLLGGVIGTVLVVALVKTLGMRVVGLFFSPEKIAQTKWLKDSPRFELLMLVCFLVPGTPKDILTYVAGLTTCPAWRIVVITTVGRVPSIVSSTLAAGLAAEGNWIVAAAVLAATAVLALSGAALYAYVAKRRMAKRGDDARGLRESVRDEAAGAFARLRDMRSQGGFARPRAAKPVVPGRRSGCAKPAASAKRSGCAKPAASGRRSGCAEPVALAKREGSCPRNACRGDSL